MSVQNDLITVHMIFIGCVHSLVMSDPTLQLVCMSVSLFQSVQWTLACDVTHSVLIPDCSDMLQSYLNIKCPTCIFIQQFLWVLRGSKVMRKTGVIVLQSFSWQHRLSCAMGHMVILLFVIKVIRSTIPF